MINELAETILLAQGDSSQLPRIATLAQAIPKLSDEEVDLLLDRLLDFGDALQAAAHQLDERLSETTSSEAPVMIDQLLQPVIHQLVVREEELGNTDQPKKLWGDVRHKNVVTLYQLSPASSDLRNHLLRWLATEGSDGSIRSWTDLICEDPPQHRLGIVLAFAPLMQAQFDPPAWMLEQLVNEATKHSQIAPAVFDLFNYFFRHQRVDSHPALPRVDELTALLGQLAGQLGKVEEGDFPSTLDVQQINQLVSDSVALIVSLCDTFSLLEHEPAIGKLHQALELRHRRVQTEAAAALARLGDDLGKKTLVAMAEQPIARLRVLAYAEELGFKHEISLELQGEIALAESHLAIWLSEPAQMGLAPSNIEFLESREMYWPSYEHPVQCYLFKYSYGSGEQAHSNIGICGPLTHAFAADLQHLEYDDVYAAFAGWQTVHREIYQVSLARAEQTFPNDWRRLLGNLAGESLTDVQPRIAGSFFGDLVLIADATSDGETGTAITDSQQVNWYSHGNAAAPIDWQLAYAIWRGQQLLSSFNESGSETESI